MRRDGRAARARDALTLLLSGVLLASACTRCGQRTQEGASVNQGPHLAAAGWTCRIGSRGGFTGGGSGSIVRADGTVLTWSQITPDESLTTEPAGHASSPALRALAAAATAPALVGLGFQKSGNMTAFLEWQQDGRLRGYSWPVGPRQAPLPEALRQAYDAALAAVRSAQP